jgi:DNA-binding response OmpR family regulator
MQRVLLVDDDADVRRTVGDMLRRSGYEVLTAENGGSALAALQPGGVDLVIADRRMPGMDGMALARRIRERSPGLPVVILTGYGDLESYLCAMGLGVLRYVGKPIGLRELQRTVREALAEAMSGPAPGRDLAEPTQPGGDRERPVRRTGGEDAMSRKSSELLRDEEGLSVPGLASVIDRFSRELACLIALEALTTEEREAISGVLDALRERAEREGRPAPPSTPHPMEVYRMLLLLAADLDLAYQRIGSAA